MQVMMPLHEIGTGNMSLGEWITWFNHNYTVSMRKMKFMTQVCICTLVDSIFKKV